MDRFIFAQRHPTGQHRLVVTGPLLGQNRPSKGPINLKLHCYGPLGAHYTESLHAGGAGKARFNVATPTYEARTRPLHVQHTYYRIIFKQNPFNIISRGVQR